MKSEKYFLFYGRESEITKLIKGAFLVNNSNIIT